MDLEWATEMEKQASNLIAIMRAHDDEGIGARAQLDTRIQRIFDLFACGEDFAAGKMILSLNGAKERLIQDDDRNFGGIDKDMDGWVGEAADQFRDFVHDLRDGIRLMEDRIDTLNMILRSHQALVLGMRKDVNELVKHTLDGIAAAATDGWKVGFSVIGAVVGVVGTFVGSIGGPPGVVLGSVAAAMASGAISTAVEAHDADSELGVIVQFVNSGEGMLHLVDVERAKIEQAFRDLAVSVTDAKLRQVRPERPLIVTAPDFRPETFGLSDQDQGRHRRPQDTRDLVPEPKRRPSGPYDQTTVDGQPHDRYPEQGPA